MLEFQDLQKLTREEMATLFQKENTEQEIVLSANNKIQTEPLLFCLNQAKRYLLEAKLPPQKYSETQIYGLNESEFQIFIQYFGLIPFPEKKWIVQILRFMDYLAPSHFQNIFTYQYTTEKNPTTFWHGKLLKPIENMPTGYVFQALNVEATFYVWQNNTDNEEGSLLL